MSRRAQLIACTGVLAVATATSALAAPKKVCNLVQDGAGDASRLYVSGATGQNSSALDVLSTDIASNSKQVTTVIRVATLSATDTQSPFGMAWRASFKVGEFELYTKAMVDRAGAATYEYGFIENAIENKLGETEGLVAIDTAKNEVRVTAPVLGFVTKGGGPTVGKKGTNITAKTFRAMPRPAVDSDVDNATSTKTYSFGAASCVTVGK